VLNFLLTAVRDGSAPVDHEERLALALRAVGVELCAPPRGPSSVSDVDVVELLQSLTPELYTVFIRDVLSPGLLAKAVSPKVLLRLLGSSGVSQVTPWPPCMATGEDVPHCALPLLTLARSATASCLSSSEVHSLLEELRTCFASSSAGDGTGIWKTPKRACFVLQILGAVATSLCNAGLSEVVVASIPATLVCAAITQVSLALSAMPAEVEQATSVLAVLVSVLATNVESRVLSSLVTMYLQHPSPICFELVTCALTCDSSTALSEIAACAPAQHSDLVRGSCSYFLEAVQVFQSGGLSASGFTAPVITREYQESTVDLFGQDHKSLSDPKACLAGVSLLAACVHNFSGTISETLNTPDLWASLSVHVLTGLLELGLLYPDQQYLSILINLCSGLDTEQCQIQAEALLSSFVTSSSNLPTLLLGSGLRGADMALLVDLYSQADARKPTSVHTNFGERLLSAILLWELQAPNATSRCCTYLEGLLSFVKQALPVQKVGARSRPGCSYTAHWTLVSCFRCCGLC
jgi:hypothetical protein